MLCLALIITICVAFDIINGVKQVIFHVHMTIIREFKLWKLFTVNGLTPSISKYACAYILAPTLQFSLWWMKFGP